MNFKDIKDKKIAEEELNSHAECLAAMDCLVHHMNDEDEITWWLQNGVPDNSHWNVLCTKPRLLPYDDRTEFYEDLARGMTYGDYEECVRIFALAVKAQCFKTKYEPRSFT